MAVFFIFCSLFLYFFIFFFLVNFSSYVSIAVNTVVVDCVSTRDLSMLLKLSKNRQERRFTQRMLPRRGQTQE
jgi:hypothetical protein